MDSVSNRVKVAAAIVLGLTVLTIIVLATAAQGAFHLEYADGVERDPGISVQRVTVEAADIAYRGRTQAVSVSVPRPAPSAPSAPSGSVWDRLAACESGGNWHTNTGNGYSGGLQFTASTWRAAGGTKYAPSAHQASREQQIAVAQAWLARTSWSQWPACSRKLGLR